MPSASKPGRIAKLRRISGRPAPQSTAASSSSISSDPKTPSGQRRGPGPRQPALSVADLHDPPDQEAPEQCPVPSPGASGPRRRRGRRGKPQPPGASSDPPPGASRRSALLQGSMGGRATPRCPESGGPYPETLDEEREERLGLRASAAVEPPPADAQSPDPLSLQMNVSLSPGRASRSSGAK